MSKTPKQSFKFLLDSYLLNALKSEAKLQNISVAKLLRDIIKNLYY